MSDQVCLRFYMHQIRKLHGILLLAVGLLWERRPAAKPFKAFAPSRPSHKCANC